MKGVFIPEISVEMLKNASLDTIEDFFSRILNDGDVAIWDAELTRWIPCSDHMPECEQEVLICTKKRFFGKEAYIDPVVTPAIYEDGTMLENNSVWRWEDINYAGWDEEEDCGIIPEGWWENRHYNPDDVYNQPVDDEVIAWMPLPEAYKGEKE